MLSRPILTEILEPRVEEIFSLIDQEIQRTKLKELLASGVVITGGSALLPGIVEIADQVFQLPARVGHPRRISGLVEIVDSPVYATAVGLVLYGMEHQPARKFRIRDGNIFSRVTARMKSWFRN
jgi:cell division protein FtsA